MWTLKFKSKMFISLVAALIAADMLVGIPNQSHISVVAPHNVSAQTKE